MNEIHMFISSLKKADILKYYEVHDSNCIPDIIGLTELGLQQKLTAHLIDLSEHFEGTKTVTDIVTEAKEIIGSDPTHFIPSERKVSGQDLLNFAKTDTVKLKLSSDHGRETFLTVSIRQLKALIKENKDLQFSITRTKLGKFITLLVWSVDNEG